MKALVLSPAKLREPSLVERFDYYRKLLRSRLPIDLRQVRKGPLTAPIPAGYRIIALDERGEQPTSIQLAERLAQYRRENVAGMAFLVGAADGLTPEDLGAAHERMSLSNLTLPHQLCVVILAEQIYRATAINRGEAYHRE